MSQIIVDLLNLKTVHHLTKHILNHDCTFFWLLDSSPHLPHRICVAQEITINVCYMQVLTLMKENI